MPGLIRVKAPGHLLIHFADAAAHLARCGASLHTASGTPIAAQYCEVKHERVTCSQCLSVERQRVNTDRKDSNR